MGNNSISPQAAHISVATQSSCTKFESSLREGFHADLTVLLQIYLHPLPALTRYKGRRPQHLQELVLQGLSQSLSQPQPLKQKGCSRMRAGGSLLS